MKNLPSFYIATNALAKKTNTIFITHTNSNGKTSKAYGNKIILLELEILKLLSIIALTAYIFKDLDNSHIQNNIQVYVLTFSSILDDFQVFYSCIIACPDGDIRYKLNT